MATVVSSRLKGEFAFARQCPISAGIFIFPPSVYGDSEWEWDSQAFQRDLFAQVPLRHVDSNIRRRRLAVRDYRLAVCPRKFPFGDRISWLARYLFFVAVRRGSGRDSINDPTGPGDRIVNSLRVRPSEPTSSGRSPRLVSRLAGSFRYDMFLASPSIFL